MFNVQLLHLELRFLSCVDQYLLNLLNIIHMDDADRDLVHLSYADLLFHFLNAPE